jgi:hypothetical protein
MMMIDDDDVNRQGFTLAAWIGGVAWLGVALV